MECEHEKVQAIGLGIGDYFVSRYAVICLDCGNAIFKGRILEDEFIK